MANRRIPLAWHNLLHQPVRSGVAIVGVTFAAVLMFMQLGFLEAVKASATVVYDELRFDICIRSRDYDRLTDCRSFDRSRLHDAQETPGVASAAPLLVGIFSWRNQLSGEPRAILGLGVPPSPAVFDDRRLQEAVDRGLDHPQSILIDTFTRREFGPADGVRFGPADAGRTVELNEKALEIVGVYSCGTGLSAGGGVIMHQHDFLRSQPLLSREQVSLGLVKVAPGADAAAVARRLRQSLPGDVDVLTRDEVLRGEIQHWVWETNYGLIFQTGVLVAVVVGTAIVYQVLASEVATRMPEYATLKAIGYGNRYLVRVMFDESLLLSLLAFIAGWAIAAVLYEITAFGAQIPIRMTVQNLVLVLSLTSALCITSGLVAIRRAYRADPADLF